MEEPYLDITNVIPPLEMMKRQLDANNNICNRLILVTPLLQRIGPQVILGQLKDNQKVILKRVILRLHAIQHAQDLK